MPHGFGWALLAEIILPTSPKRRERYRVTDDEIDDCAGAYWRLPDRLITDDIARKVWAMDRGASISLFPVLAAFGWMKDKEGNAWSRPVYKAQDCLAHFAGIGYNSVHVASLRLQSLGLVRTERVRRGPGEFGVTAYRVSAECYPMDERDRYRKVPRVLFVGGIWAKLSPAARLVLLAILALDEVRSEEKVTEYAMDEYKAEDGEDTMRRMRATRPVRRSTITKHTGITGGQLDRAIQALRSENLLCSDKHAGFWIPEERLSYYYGAEHQAQTREARRAPERWRRQRGLLAAKRAKKKRGRKAPSPAGGAAVGAGLGAGPHPLMGMASPAVGAGPHPPMGASSCL